MTAPTKGGGAGGRGIFLIKTPFTSWNLSQKCPTSVEVVTACIQEIYLFIFGGVLAHFRPCDDTP